MGFNIRGHQRGRQSVKKPLSIQLFIVTPSMAGVNGKVHVFTLVLGNIRNIGLGDRPDDCKFDSRFSVTCLFGGSAWRRPAAQERRRGAGTLEGSREEGTGGSRGNGHFLVTTCVDTCLKVGGECKGRFAD